MRGSFAVGVASALFVVGLAVGLSAPSMQSVTATSSNANASAISDVWVSNDGHAVVEFREGTDPEIVAIADESGSPLQSAWVHRGQDVIALDLVAEDSIPLRSVKSGNVTNAPPEVFEDPPQTNKEPLSTGQYRVVAWSGNEKVGEHVLVVSSAVDERER